MNRIRRYFIHMAYDGAAYHGWQVQPNGLTVQEVMEKALSTMLRREISVVGAGRTDAGVHASGFVAHFDLPASQPQNKNQDSSIKSSHHQDETIEDGLVGIHSQDETIEDGPGQNILFRDSSSQIERNQGIKQQSTPRQNPDVQSEDFLFKLNRFLPPDITVFSIREVDPEMHARFSATSRTYHYLVSAHKPLYRRNYSHYIFGSLDLEEIRRCCDIILNASDFTSFSKLHTGVKTNICDVKKAAWRETSYGYRFEITADRFLRNMVRSLTGTLLDVGQGKLDSRDFIEILEAKDRGKAGQSAPAKGLFLVDISYEGISLPIADGPG